VWLWLGNCEVAREGEGKGRKVPALRRKGGGGEGRKMYLPNPVQEEHGEGERSGGSGRGSLAHHHYQEKKEER